MRVRWEYCSARDFESVQRLGQLGWELISALGSPEQPTFYLKRPVEAWRDRVTRLQRNQVFEARGLDPADPADPYVQEQGGPGE